MKVAFVTDYEFTSSISGAEVSINLLAKGLSSEGLSLCVICPNTNNLARQEILDGIKIFRFPFISSPQNQAFRPFVYSNPLWYFYSTLAITWIAYQNNIRIIHAQGKGVYIGSWLASKILRRKIIVTVRDYRLVCDLGNCLQRQERACTDWEYLRSDLPAYLSTHGGKHSVFLTYLIALVQIFLRKIHRTLLANTDKIICISKKQEEIFNNSKISNTTTIHNTANFPKISNIKRTNTLIFIGRYTLGKGKHILDKLVPAFLKTFPNWKVLIIGRGKIPDFGPKVKIVPHLPTYDSVLQTLSTSKILVAPSVWPEPFGRAALDAISVGTPVVVSNRGGLPEIVASGTTGEIVSADPTAFLNGISKIIRRYPKYQQGIKKKLSFHRKKFQQIPLNAHINLYLNFNS